MSGRLNGSGSNGSGDGPGDAPKRETNIASLEEVRKRATAKAKADQKKARGPSDVRERIVGAVLILMALGAVWHFVATGMGGKGLVW